MESVLDLGKSLIKARITAGLTERQLADRLRFDEDQLKRHESMDYQTIDLAGVIEIASVLGLLFTAEIQLPDQAGDGGDTEAIAARPANPATVSVAAGE